MPALSESSSRSGRSASGMLTLWAMRPVSNSMIDGSPTPTATVASVRRCPISSIELAHERVGVRDVRLDELLRRQLAVLERRRSDLRASDVEADELAVHYSFAAAASSR